MYRLQVGWISTEQSTYYKPTVLKPSYLQSWKILYHLRFSIAICDSIYSQMPNSYRSWKIPPLPILGCYYFRNRRACTAQSYWHAAFLHALWNAYFYRPGGWRSLADLYPNICWPSPWSAKVDGQLIIPSKVPMRIFTLGDVLILIFPPLQELRFFLSSECGAHVELK